MELRIIRQLIEEVLVVCKNDDTGVTFDLLEPAIRAAQEIGMTQADVEKMLDEA